MRSAMSDRPEAPYEISQVHITLEVRDGGADYLFSHAGIIPQTLEFGNSGGISLGRRRSELVHFVSYTKRAPRGALFVVSANASSRDSADQ